MEITTVRYLNALNVQLYKWRWALVSFSECQVHVYCVSCNANITKLKSTILDLQTLTNLCFETIVLLSSGVPNQTGPRRPKTPKHKAYLTFRKPDQSKNGHAKICLPQVWSLMQFFVTYFWVSSQWNVIWGWMNVYWHAGYLIKLWISKFEPPSWTGSQNKWPNLVVCWIVALLGPTLRMRPRARRPQPSQVWLIRSTRCSRPRMSHFPMKVKIDAQITDWVFLKIISSGQKNW